MKRRVVWVGSVNLGKGIGTLNARVVVGEPVGDGWRAVVTEIAVPDAMGENSWRRAEGRQVDIIRDTALIALADKVAALIPAGGAG